LAGATLAMALILGASAAGAEEYPAREIKAICNFGAGSGADVFVRYFAEKLRALAGKPVIVDNKVGALGNLGTETAAKSKADGYTILIAPGSSTMAAASHIFKKLPFDPVKDFTPVTTLAKIGFVITVDAKTPYTSLPELTTALKAKGDKATYGIVANTGLVTAELYKKVAGLQAVKAQYKEMGTLANDMAAGALDFAAADAVWAIQQQKAGRVRMLAVSTAKRMLAMPDLPTVNEAGQPDFGDLTAWWAVFVPAGTPPEIVAKLEGWFNEIVASEETKAFLNNLGSDPFPGNSSLLRDQLASDIAKWADFVKLANIEPL
jgi:tripartite-type tricarboxylate transporter receptor subunit TctC